MDKPPRTSPARWPLAGLILALGLACAVYRFLEEGKLEQTAALFIGLPAILAFALALAPPAGSVTGMIIKGMTIALLMTAPLPGEGFICILMASPLFYVIGLLIGLLADRDRKRRRRITTLPIILLLPMSFEGARDRLSFPRHETVTAEKIVDGSPGDVEAALRERPRFDAYLPLFLRLGFPRPVESSGSGLKPGDRRIIRFAGGEGEPGDLVLEVATRRPGFVRFRVVSDGSRIAHWMEWETSEVRWEGTGDGRTRVSWTLRYRRLLDPAWYFGPLERFGAGLAADHLIDTLATPAADVAP